VTTITEIYTAYLLRDVNKSTDQHDEFCKNKQNGVTVNKKEKQQDAVINKHATLRHQIYSI
jgi:hypothetical protein